MIKKMVEQGYNYLDSPIRSMVDFFETRIENLEKSIPPSSPSRNNGKSEKESKKKKAVTLTILIMKIQIKDIQERSFASTMIRANISRINALLSGHWPSKQNRKTANNLTRRKGSPNMR